MDKEVKREYVIPTIDPDITIKEKENLYGWATMWRGDQFVGTARWCCACELWLDVMNSYVNGLGDIVVKGANCNEFGDWKCYKCAYIDKKPNRTARDVGTSTVQIPAEYADASLNELKPAQRSVLGQWGRKYKFIVVFGNPGSGKTRVSWAFQKKFIQEKRPFVCLDAPIAQRGWSSCLQHPERAKLELQWENHPYLILDDLSACQPSDAWIRVVHIMIDRRRLAQRPTIITTAADAIELQNKYGEAIHSRLNEFEWVKLPGKDWRLAGKANDLDFEKSGGVGGSSK